MIRMGKKRSRQRIVLLAAALAAAAVIAISGWLLRDVAVELWLIRRLESTDREENFEALSRLSEMGSARAIPAFLRFEIHSRKWWISPATYDNHGEFFGKTLLRIFEKNPGATIAALARTLRDDDPQVRAKAAGGICLVGPAAAGAIPALDAALEDPDASVRLSTAAALLALGASDEAVLSVLRESLHHPDGDPRSSSAYLISVMGKAARPAIPDLIECLKRGHDGPDDRDFILDGLASMGGAAADPLSLLLTDGDARVRAEAALCLGRLGPAAEPAAPALIGLLDDAVEGPRAQAVEALGRMGPAAAAAAPRIIALAEAESIDMKTAVRALAGIEPLPEMAVPFLLKALEHPDPEVNLDAVKALSSLGPVAAAAIPLLELLPRSSIALRVWGDFALARIQPERMAAWWKGFLAQLAPPGSLEDEEFAAACEVIERFGPAAREAAPFLVSEILDTLPYLSWEIIIISFPPPRDHRAAYALRRIEVDRQALGPILKRIQDENSEVRALAAQALMLAGPAARPAEPELKNAVSDPDHRVRWFARAALRNLEREDGPWLPQR